MTAHVADILLTNGRVWTGQDAGAPAATALAVRDGRVLAVGSDDEVRAAVGSAAVTVDLDGRTVLPGLTDSHVHAVRGGVSWDVSLHWEDLRSLADGLEQIRRRAAELPAGSWISVVGGWHARQLAERRGPTRAELDAVAPDHPVYVQMLYDEAVLNSAALRECGWAEAGVPDPARGTLERDDDGRPTGVVRGVGAFAVPISKALAVTPEQGMSGTRRMLREFAAHGLTAVADGGGLLITPEDYKPMYRLWEEDGLATRVRLFISAWTRGGEEADVDQLTRFLHPGFGDGMLQVSGVGEIAHLGCHDMEGLEPFELTDASFVELVEITRMCVRRGWPMSVHAVLRSTLQRVLDAWEQVAADEGGLGGRRFSIVHADGAGEDEVRRMAALGAGALLQNRLTLKATDYHEEWGRDATVNAPPIGLFRKHGVVIGGGSDATRANWFSPWASLQWLVTGGSVDGAEPRLPEHRLTIGEALLTYTRDAVWFTEEEDRRGRLVPGHAADLTIPTRDPFTCPPDELGDIRSDLTLLGGRVTHASGDAPAGVEGLPRL